MRWQKSCWVVTACHELKLQDMFARFLMGGLYVAVGFVEGAVISYRVEVHPARHCCFFPLSFSRKVGCGECVGPSRTLLAGVGSFEGVWDSCAALTEFAAS